MKVLITLILHQCTRTIITTIQLINKGQIESEPNIRLLSRLIDLYRLMVRLSTDSDSSNYDLILPV